MKDFVIIEDLTSDEYMEVFGKDLKVLFENAARGMFSIISKIDKVQPKEKEILEVNGTDPKDLLYNWLTHLIAQVDTEEKFYSKFNITEIDNTHLVAEIWGEPIVPEKGNLVVKAVTFYKFDLIKEKDSTYRATVSLDV